MKIYLSSAVFYWRYVINAYLWGIQKIDDMLNIALFGPPGAGKGTQAKRIVEKYKLAHISTGDMIRKEIAEGTEMGKMAADIINRGELLSDELVVNMIRIYSKIFLRN